MIAERAAEKGFVRDEKLWKPKKFPIEQSWYDANYFEEPRRKSAYPYANTWANMRKSYIELAHMALTGFPFSNSFLDAGCGRGLFLRALFELTMRNNMGFDASGFDFSEYALSTVDQVSKPFVELASVDEFEFKRSYDVLFMVNICEHLTDEQIKSWLGRAKKNIKTAMFALISRNDPHTLIDFGAFNIKTMQTWNELFNASGWKQDQEAIDMQNLANLSTIVKNTRCDAFYFKPRK